MSDSTTNNPTRTRRDRRLLLILVGLVFVVGYAGVALSRPPSDGLEWIRKYGGYEDPPEENAILGLDDVAPALTRSFRFGGKVPPALYEDVKRMGKRMPIPGEIKGDETWQMPGGQFAHVSLRTGIVQVTAPVRQSWLEKTWDALMKRLGHRKPSMADKFKKDAFPER